MSDPTTDNGSPTSTQLDERRRYVRFMTSMTVGVSRTRGEEILDSAVVDLINIGAGGACFRAEEAYAAGSTVALRVPFPSQTVTISGRILSSKSGIHHVEFSTFSDDFQKNLAAVIDAIISKQDLAPD